MSMRKIYREIARKHHVSVQEVRDEMQKALNMAWVNPEKTEAQAANQKRIPTKGQIPTVEEFIHYAKGEFK